MKGLNSIPLILPQSTQSTQSGNGHFLLYSIMMEKLAQAGERLPPYTLSTIMYKVLCTLQMRGQIHSTYFCSNPICTLWTLPSLAVREFDSCLVGLRSLSRRLSACWLISLKNACSCSSGMRKENIFMKKTIVRSVCPACQQYLRQGYRLRYLVPFLHDLFAHLLQHLFFPKKFPPFAVNLNPSICSFSRWFSPLLLAHLPLCQSHANYFCQGNNCPVTYIF